MQIKSQLQSLPRQALTALIAAIIIAALFGAVNTFAGDKLEDRGADRMAEKMTERLEDHLDLSDAQEDEIEQILTKSIQQRRQLMRDHRGQMSALWNQPTLTAAEIQAAISAQHNEQAMQARHAAQMALLAGTLAEIHAVLTPEQRQKMADKGLMRWFHGGHHGGRHHDRHGDKRHDGDRGHY